MMRAIVLLTFLVASQAAPATTAPKAAPLAATKVTAVKAEPPAVKKSSPIKLGAKFDPRAGKKAVAAKSAAPLAAKKAESVKLVAKPSPLATMKVPGHVQLSAEQKKTMHWGCVTACKPSPVESKCVTACEAASYRCIDETGPGETPKDTKKCQDGVLKLYQETKGLKKEEKKKEAKKEGKKGKKEGKKDEKKADKKEKKKASSLLQVVRDDDNSEADESSEESDESSEGNSEDAEESSDDAMDIGEQENDEDEEDKANQEAAAVEDSPMEDSATDDANEDESASDDAADESLAQVSRSTDDDDSSEDGSDDSASADESEEDSSEEEESDDDLRDQAMTEAANAAPADEEDQSVDSTADLKKLMDSKFGEKIPNATEEVPSLLELKSSWKPEPCGELEPGVPCTHLYEHPQGSTVVMPCPVEQQANPEACGALFGNKADGEQCSQITCPKALGVTMKLICGGGCCPSCWAPDHVIKVDRHTSIDDAAVVDPAPQAASTCGGVKCFKTTCAAGFTEGFVNGSCCYSCVPGR